MSAEPSCEASVKSVQRDTVAGSADQQQQPDRPKIHIQPDVSPPPSPPSSNGPTSAFGTLLEPVLRDACRSRLSTVNWFRADWQRGGALTGYATWTDEQGESHQVVVKLPVPPCERRWLVRLQAFDDVVPHVYAHGEALGGYDLAWVVMERLSYGPLGASWDGREFDLLVEAIGRFYAAAQHAPHDGQHSPADPDWHAVLKTARQRAAAGALPDAQRWAAALKKATKKLKRWTHTWASRTIDGWCHGDLHLGNAMTRLPPPEGPAVLFDFAHTRPGHWLQDAVYLESQFWHRPQRLSGRRLCRQVAQQRKHLRLPLEQNWAQIAEVKRALLAMSVPVNLQRDGDPQYVAAALNVLERAVA